MLKRDKNSVRLPSGSNISINAPSQSVFNPLFDSSIKYLQDKIENDDKYKADILASKIENEKIRTGEYDALNRKTKWQGEELQRRIDEDKRLAAQKALSEKKLADKLEKERLKEAQKLKNAEDHRTYSIAEMQLGNQVLHLSQKYYNNPAEFDKLFLEYYQEQAKNVPLNENQDYELDFSLKFNSLRNQFYGPIYKEFRTSSANADWETLKNVSNQASQITFESIKNIESIQELMLHGTNFTNQLKSLEKGFTVWNDAHVQYKQDADYLKEIHFPIMQDHDENLLTHALANSEKFGILDGTIESTFLAEEILKVWSGETISKEINNLDLSKENKAMVKTFAGILMNNTHPNWGTEKQDIADHVQNEIEATRKKYKDDFITRNKAMQDDNMDWIDNINWNDPQITFPSENDLRKNATKIDNDGLVVSDEDLSTKLIKQRNDYNQLRTAVEHMSKGEGSVLTAVDLLDGTQWEGNDAVNTIMEAKYRKLFGANFNSVYTFDVLADSIKNAPNGQIPPVTASILYHMEKDKYFPQEFIDTLKIMEGLKFDTEDEQNALINMAIVYNASVGKNTVGVGNLQDMPLARTLHDVYHTWKSNQMNPIPAIQIWKEQYNYDEKAKGELRTKITEFVANNEEISLFFNEELVNLSDFAEWVSMAKYSGLLKKSLGGDINLENILIDANTFYFGFWKNMSIEKSGLIEYKKIVTELLVKDLGNNTSPSDLQIKEKLENSKFMAILQMSKNEYDISFMDFNHEVGNGPVLMKKGTSIASITGMKREQLATSALAFSMQTLQTMSGEEIANQLGMNFPSDDIADKWSRIYDLVDENKIKMEYMPSTADKGNEQFHIWFKNDQNIWTVLKKEGVPVAWTPNNRYSMNMGYTRSSLMEELAQERARQKTEEYFSKDKKWYDLSVAAGSAYPNTEQGREAFYKNELFLQQQFLVPLMDKWEVFKDSIAETFGWNDQIKNTVSEKISAELTEIDISVQNKQQELNESFDSNTLLFTHYSLFSDPLDIKNDADVESLRKVWTEDKVSKKEQTKRLEMIENGTMTISNEDKFQMVNMRVAENYNTLGEIYKDIGVVVHPAHQFVLQDIIDVTGTEYIDKGTPIYNAIKNENFALALKEIKNLNHQFSNKARYEALLTYWGNPKKSIK